MNKEQKKLLFKLKVTTVYYNFLIYTCKFFLCCFISLFILKIINYTTITWKIVFTPLIVNYLIGTSHFLWDKYIAKD